MHTLMDAVKVQRFDSDVTSRERSRINENGRIPIELVSKSMGRLHKCESFL